MIVVSWMVEVAEEFGLQQETLHAAVALLDRFLATSNVSCVSAGGNRGVGGCGGKVCVLCCVCACVCVCVCVCACVCGGVSATFLLMCLVRNGCQAAAAAATGLSCSSSNRVIIQQQQQGCEALCRKSSAIHS